MKYSIQSMNQTNLVCQGARRRRRNGGATAAQRHGWRSAAEGPARIAHKRIRDGPGWFTIRDRPGCAHNRFLRISAGIQAPRLARFVKKAPRHRAGALGGSAERCAPSGAQRSRSSRRERRAALPVDRFGRRLDERGTRGSGQAALRLRCRPLRFHSPRHGTTI